MNIYNTRYRKGSKVEKFGYRKILNGMEKIGEIKEYLPGMKINYNKKTYIPEVIHNIDSNETYLLINTSGESLYIRE